MNIKYNVKFYSNWHCGSGLSAGANMDAYVVRDAEGFPFIPGKTLKGLIREEVENIITYRNKWDELSSSFVTFFGNSKDKDRTLNRELMDSEFAMRGDAFFSNASFSLPIKQHILSKELQNMLFTTGSYTAIDEKGIAVDHSLRVLELSIPCTLEAEILNIPKELVSTVEESLKCVRHIGMNRNRGLGRCEISIVEL